MSKAKKPSAPARFKLSMKPCECGHKGCRHVILLPYYVRMRKDDAEPLVRAYNTHSALFDAVRKSERLLVHLAGGTQDMPPAREYVNQVRRECLDALAAVEK